MQQYNIVNLLECNFITCTVYLHMIGPWSQAESKNEWIKPPRKKEWMNEWILMSKRAIKASFKTEKFQGKFTPKFK